MKDRFQEVGSGESAAFFRKSEFQLEPGSQFLAHIDEKLGVPFSGFQYFLVKGVFEYGLEQAGVVGIVVQQFGGSAGYFGADLDDFIEAIKQHIDLTSLGLTQSLYPFHQKINNFLAGD